MELNPDLTEKLKLHSGEPLPKLYYLSIHQVLSAFRGGMNSQERKPWKILRDTRCYYWWFLKKIQLTNNMKLDAEAFEKILMAEKSRLKHRMGEAGPGDYALLVAAMVDLDERLEGAHASSVKVRELMQSLDDRLLVLVEQFRRVKIAAIISSSPTFLDAYVKISGHAIPHEYLRMRAKGRISTSSNFCKIL